MKEPEDEAMARLFLLAVKCQDLRRVPDLQGADIGDFFLLQVGQGQREMVLAGHVTQLAGREVLAFLEGHLEPGVLVLELPFPGHFLGPEVLLHVFAAADRRARPVPGPNEIAKRLQRLARRLAFAGLPMERATATPKIVREARMRGTMRNLESSAA